MKELTGKAIPASECRRITGLCKAFEKTLEGYPRHPTPDKYEETFAKLEPILREAHQLGIVSEDHMRGHRTWRLPFDGNFSYAFNFQEFFLGAARHIRIHSEEIGKMGNPHRKEIAYYKRRRFDTDWQPAHLEHAQV